tara:strand:+ start:9382 stop:9531 length:150 start_codon:yes stop_codon:yes gene_type:complete
MTINTLQCAKGVVNILNLAREMSSPEQHLRETTEQRAAMQHVWFGVVWN